MVRFFHLDPQLPAGIWEVWRLGALCRLQSTGADVGLRVYFRERPSAHGGPPRWATREISLTHLALLPIGQLLDGTSGELLSSEGNGSGRSMKLDFSAGNVGFVRRSSLAIKHEVPAILQDPEADYVLARLQGSASRPTVLIPCATLFAHYWCVTSTLTRSVIQGEWNEPCRHIHTEDGFHIDELGGARITVRKKWRDDEARYLALLLADDQAVQSAIEIHASFAREMASCIDADVAPQLYVRPPFERLSEVKGVFHTLERRNESSQEVLLLSHIISSSSRTLISHVTVFRETGRRGSETEDFDQASPEIFGPNEVSQAGRRALGLIAPPNPSITERPAGFGDAGVEALVLQPIDERFLMLSGVTFEKADHEGREQRERSSVLPRTVHGELSAVHGTKLTGEEIVPAILLPSSTSHETDPIDEEALVEPLDKELLKLLRDCAQARKWPPISDEIGCVSVTAINPFHAVGHSASEGLFSLPRTIRGHDFPWLFRDARNKSSRRAICLRFDAPQSAGGPRTRYVLDFEARVPKQREHRGSSTPIKHSAVAVWFQDRPSEAETQARLVRAIEDIALNRGPLLHGSPHNATKTAILKHGYTDILKFVRRVFDAKEQFPARAEIERHDAI